VRGRKPKPVERQIAEGDPRKHGKAKLQERLRNQVKATSGLPGCPRYLRGRARSAWNFWSTELQAMKMDRRPDGPMLEGACRAYERAVKADLIVDKEGLTFAEKFIDEESGEAIILKIKKHPAVDISNRSWLIVRAFCSEFGLSPVSRMRLSPDKEDDDSADADLMAALSQPREPRPQFVQ